jgi:hypothetical protein
MSRPGRRPASGVVHRDGAPDDHGQPVRPDGLRTVGAPPRGRRSVEEWLSLIIVGSLATYLLIGVVMWSWMILTGVPAPGGFTTVLTAIAGAMAGIAAPLSVPTTSRDATPEPPADGGPDGPSG